MFESARIPALENTICRQYRLAHNETVEVSDDNGTLCKNVEVQTRLARINGWCEFVSAVQGQWSLLRTCCR